MTELRGCTGASVGGVTVKENGCNHESETRANTTKELSRWPHGTELVLVRGRPGPRASRNPGHLCCCQGYNSGAKEVK